MTLNEVEVSIALLVTQFRLHGSSPRYLFQFEMANQFGNDLDELRHYETTSILLL